MTLAPGVDSRRRIGLELREASLADAGGAIRVYIDRPGIEHIDFSDEPFWDGGMTSEKLPEKLKTVADTRGWVRAFFDGTVRGQWADLKALAGESRPDVTVQVFGRMWP